MDRKKALSGLSSIAMLLIVFPLSLAQNSGSPLPGAKTFFVSENRIWAYDQTSFSSELILDPGAEGIDGLIGNTTASPDRENLYFIIFPDEGNRLLYRLNLSTHASKVIFEDQRLGRISEPSPDENRMIAFLADLEAPQNPVNCVLSIPSGNCDQANITVDFNEFWWLDSSTFLTSNLHDIKIYQFLEDNSVQLSQNYVSESYFMATAIMPDKKSLVLYSYMSPGYHPSFLSFDLVSNQIESLGQFDLSQLEAAVHSLELAPNGEYLSYQVTTDLFVFELSTGDTIIEVHDVLNHVWSANGHILLDSLLPSFTLLDLDVVTSTTREIGTFGSEIHFIS